MAVHGHCTAHPAQLDTRNHTGSYPEKFWNASSITLTFPYTPTNIYPTHSPSPPADEDAPAELPLLLVSALLPLSAETSAKKEDAGREEDDLVEEDVGSFTMGSCCGMIAN